jgi:hypothetical protein
MTVAIIGSRNYVNRAKVHAVLDALHLNSTMNKIVSGGAVGPDTFAEEWCIAHTFPFTKFAADWTAHGKSAGFIRNTLIIDAANIVIAFWDGASKGTAHSIKLAKQQNKKVIIVNS